eukprot:TRINITY_DN21287_c0_g1_i2.p1 TRINITY_DN21287_c0_g1~~TRINITY_DN21287_c0_g1_i2.p1  ORF type:complete len:113 (-),score=21.31 TRINITY_DN21287_c0_g1_i2:6-344(-)
MCIRDRNNRILEAFRTNRVLRSLSMPDSEIKEEGAIIIGEVLETSKTLTKLNIRLKNIGAEGARAINRGLKVNKTLLSLSIRLSLIHISEPTRPLYISYAVFCLKKKKQIKT